MEPQDAASAVERDAEGNEIVTNPHTGQQYGVRLYRCPTCAGTRWGPGAAGAWHCLTCAAPPARVPDAILEPPDAYLARLIADHDAGRPIPDMGTGLLTYSDLRKPDEARSVHAKESPHADER